MRTSSTIAIENTFKKLIVTQSIDKITVTEICEICHINRQTFYNHYSDLFDIFQQLFKRELFEEIAQNRTVDTWHGGFLATMHYLKSNARMLLHVYDSSYRLQTNLYFIELSNVLLEHVVAECMKKKNVDLSEQDCRFIINFYRHVFKGMMMDWVNEGMKDDPEDLLKKLQIMINGSIPRSVEAFAEEEKLHWGH